MAAATAYTPLAMRRILRDTTTVREELAGHGLFWVQDEADLGHGWAIVMGPMDTPYDGAPFCFEVAFPATYPFEPPVFKYLTNDGMTRFNPNLYKEGKVCLSLLNTWPGERWSAVQSLGSVLQCIQSAVLTEDPLLNEPGYATFKEHPDFAPYRRMVFHSVLETAILRQMSVPPTFLVSVWSTVARFLEAARPRLLEKARALAAVWDGKMERMAFFNMAQCYRFETLATELEGLTLKDDSVSAEETASEF